MMRCSRCQNDQWRIVAGRNLCSKCGHAHESFRAPPIGRPPVATTGLRFEAQQGQDYSGLVKLAYVTAIIMPVVGFILGLVVATRQSLAARHGVRIIVISLVAAVVFVGVILSQEARVANNNRVAAREQALKTQICDAVNTPIKTMADLQFHASALADAAKVDISC